MWLQCIGILLLGFISTVSAAEENERNRSEPAHASGQARAFAPQRAVPNAARIQSSVPQNSSQEQSRTVQRGSSRESSGNRGYYRGNNGYNGNTTVYYGTGYYGNGYYGNGYYGNGYYGDDYYGNGYSQGYEPVYGGGTAMIPLSSYPNRYYICYQEDQSQQNQIHISCPYNTSWYSTDPAYSSLDYQTNYRPEYVCPSYGTSSYQEFDSQNDADNWSSSFCNTWQNNQSFPNNGNRNVELPSNVSPFVPY